MVRRKHSGSEIPLATTVDQILSETQVPVETGPMRILVSAIRDEEVTAERLARLASFERENFLKTREPPRLCSALYPDGTTPPRRVWAAGGWRVARRVLSPDSERGRLAAVGIYACTLIVDHGLQDERIGPLAHGFAAQSVGPIAGYYPGPIEQWQELRQKLRQVPVGPGVTNPTREQEAVEAALQQAELTPFSLYFGLDAPAGVSGGQPRELRLAVGDERGAIAFDDLVRQRARSVEEARDVLAYVEAFGRQLDDLGRPPSLGEFSERWQVDPPTAGAERHRFASIFPGEEDPAAVSRMLWDGVGRGPGLLTRLLSVKVVPSGGFPTVISQFLTGLADELDSPEGPAALTAGMLLEEAPPNPRRELARFFALCARAVDAWSADALKAVGDEPSLSGLRSLETVTDERTAAYTEALLNEYRLANGRWPGGEVLLATQKALRVASSLRRAEPPATTVPYLDGIRWAATALAVARRELRLDVVAEAKLTVQRLDAVRL
jgi:hypothetical protein